MWCRLVKSAKKVDLFRYFRKRSTFLNTVRCVRLFSGRVQRAPADCSMSLSFAALMPMPPHTITSTVEASPSRGEFS